jgi:oxygen-dependent protoporphyrinogen oxidase
MRGKLLFVSGLAVGYVLGARAGRKRYDQMRSTAAKVWESPGLQKQVHQVEDFVAEALGDVPGVLIDGAKRVVTQLSGGRRQAASRTATTTRPAPKSAKPAAKPAAKSAAKPATKPATKPTTKPAAKAAPRSKPASGSGAE